MHHLKQKEKKLKRFDLLEHRFLNTIIVLGF